MAWRGRRSDGQSIMSFYLLRIMSATSTNGILIHPRLGGYEKSLFIPYVLCLLRSSGSSKNSSTHAIPASAPSPAPFDRHLFALSLSEKSVRSIPLLPTSSAYECQSVITINLSIGRMYSVKDVQYSFGVDPFKCLL